MREPGAGWCLPGGWADVGETPSRAVERRSREAGVAVRAARLLGVFDRDFRGRLRWPAHVYKLYVLCEPLGGTPAPDGLETEARRALHACGAPAAVGQTPADQLARALAVARSGRAAFNAPPRGARTATSLHALGRMQQVVTVPNSRRGACRCHRRRARHAPRAPGLLHLPAGTGSRSRATTNGSSRPARSSTSWSSSWRGARIGPDVGAVVAALDQAEDIRDVFDDVVWRHRGKKIAPKTVTQKRYVDTIRASTVTFAIGPAGTGKTYLAIALAVRRSPRRRSDGSSGRPAVEAGERLGFLPGDLLAKVDPYMRPLFDALYDTMDADRLNAYIDRGTIEVAPLAFMRGRTLTTRS